MLLSFGVIALVVLAMLYQFVVSPQPREARRPVTFTVSAEDADKDAADRQARPKSPERTERSAAARVAPPRPPITVQKQIPRADPFEGIPGFIHMSRKDLAAADVSRMKGPAPGSASDGQGEDDHAAQGAGIGPGGVMLYKAQWRREPTRAEMATYLPQGGALSGWGRIACRTIENFRVEDCQILDEFPRGSGFGRAVQDAAWQFRIIPPRVGNKPKVGAWVSIHYEVTQRGAD